MIEETWKTTNYYTRGWILGTTVQYIDCWLIGKDCPSTIKTWSPQHNKLPSPVASYISLVFASEYKQAMSSLRRTDLLALSNLRNDGRKPQEIRRMRIQMGSSCCSSGGDIRGSAIVEMGLTTALATVTGPTECARRSDELPDRAVLEVTVAVAPFASADRRTYNASTDRLLLEASQMLQTALEATLLLQTFPRQRIQIHVSVLADDGGRLCAALNAATLAVLDAGIPMKDFCCACSAGHGGTNNAVLVDLNRREESGNDTVYLPCAILPQRGTVVLAQCEARLPDFEALEQVLEAAMEGCRAVFEYMQAAVKERAASTLAARSGRATIHAAYPAS